MITNIVELITCDVAILYNSYMTFDEVTILNFLIQKKFRSLLMPKIF
jgi:hypothetical protein